VDCYALELPFAVFERMVRQAKHEGAREAVGLLGGELRDGRAVARQAVALKSLGGTRFFLADPYSQFLGERFVQQQGQEIIGVYHSHPGGAATLSQLDRALAAPGTCAHLILAPDDVAPGTWLVRGWVHSTKGMRQVPIDITQAGGAFQCAPAPPRL